MGDNRIQVNSAFVPMPVESDIIYMWKTVRGEMSRVTLSMSDLNHKWPQSKVTSVVNDISPNLHVTFMASVLYICITFTQKRWMTLAHTRQSKTSIIRPFINQLSVLYKHPTFEEKILVNSKQVLLIWTHQLSKQVVCLPLGSDNWGSTCMHEPLIIYVFLYILCVSPWL